MIQIKVVGVMKDYLLVTLNLTLRVWRSTLNFLMKTLFFILDLKRARNFTFRYVVMSEVKVKDP